MFFRYCWYRILSEGLINAGVFGLWACILYLPYGDWNILIGAIVMFTLFGLQSLVDKTKYVKELSKELNKGGFINESM